MVNGGWERLAVTTISPGCADAQNQAAINNYKYQGYSNVKMNGKQWYQAPGDTRPCIAQVDENFCALSVVTRAREAGTEIYFARFKPRPAHTKMCHCSGC